MPTSVPGLGDICLGCSHTVLYWLFQVRLLESEILLYWIFLESFIFFPLYRKVGDRK